MKQDGKGYQGSLIVMAKKMCRCRFMDGWIELKRNIWVDDWDGGDVLEVMIEVRYLI